MEAPPPSVGGGVLAETRFSPAPRRVTQLRVQPTGGDPTTGVLGRAEKSSALSDSRPLEDVE